MHLRLVMMALAGVSSLALASPAHSGTGEWSKDFKISGRAELRVEVDDGRITLTGSDSKQIEARVIVTGWKMGPDGVQVYDRQTGDRVELDVRLATLNRWLNVGERSVRVELRVPNGLLANLHTRDGSISLDGVSGTFRLRTGDGRVEATRVDGTLDADTGDGSIRVRGRLDGMALHTGDGSIEGMWARATATLPCVCLPTLGPSSTRTPTTARSKSTSPSLQLVPSAETTFAAS